MSLVTPCFSYRLTGNLNVNEKLITEIMEDALRIAAEEGRDHIPIDILKRDTAATEDFLARAVVRLEKEGLVRRRNHKVILTRKGREKAQKILERHEIIEQYFHHILGEPKSHKVAHSLEHFVSSETTRRMEELLDLKQRGKSIMDFDPGTNILIVAVQIPDRRTFERLIGLGLTPGSKAKIGEEIQDAVILDIRGRKIALAKEIAKSLIAVRENEKY
jgi:Fe2+ transport system protein FeoA/predicted transcriptional regulator